MGFCAVHINNNPYLCIIIKKNDMEKERKVVLSFELAKQMYEGSDDKLKRLALDTYPELGRVSPEARFLELLTGCVVEVTKYGVIFNKPEGWMFEYDKKNGYFLCQYERVRSVFNSEYRYNWQQFSELCVRMVDQHLNWKGVTPECFATERCTGGLTYELEGSNTLTDFQ